MWTHGRPTLQARSCLVIVAVLVLTLPVVWAGSGASVEDPAGDLTLYWDRFEGEIPLSSAAACESAAVDLREVDLRVEGDVLLASLTVVDLADPSTRCGKVVTHSPEEWHGSVEGPAVRVNYAVDSWSWRVRLPDTDSEDDLAYVEFAAGETALGPEGCAHLGYRQSTHVRFERVCDYGRDGNTMTWRLPLEGHTETGMEREYSLRGKTFEPAWVYSENTVFGLPFLYDEAEMPHGLTL